MKKILSLFIVVLFSGLLNAQSIEKIKIVGYVPDYVDASKVDYNNLTHAIFCFLYANTDGTLQEFDKNSLERQETFLEATAVSGSKRLISLGTNNLGTVTQNASATNTLVSNLVAFCQLYGYDGVDVDWEGIQRTADSSGYSLLMSTLSNQLKPIGLTLVATIGYGDYFMKWIPQEALKKADWLQIMAYNATGSWESSPIGNSAPFSVFLAAENYWLNRGFTHDKMVIGVPFYGLKFNSTRGGIDGTSIVNYSDLVSEYPNLPDALNKVPGQLIYYNGPELIRQKCRYLKDKNFGGIMIWEMTQDAVGDKSLFKQIVCTLNDTECISQDATVCKGQDLTTGLVAELDFTGNVSDVSNTGIVAQNIGAILGEDRFGNASNAYRFTQNTQIDLGTSSALDLNEFTISAWVFTSSDDELIQPVVQKHDTYPGSFALFLQNGKLCLYLLKANKSELNLVSRNILAINKWHHVMATHSFLEGTRIYIDGKLEDEDNICFNINSTPAQHIRIGGNFDGKDYQFYGSIDDVRIYNKALNVCGADSLTRMLYNPITGFDDVDYNSLTKIFPNPTSRTFVVEYDTMFGYEVKLSLVDVLGKEVFKQTLINSKTEIDTALEDGVYFVKLISAKNSFTQKLLIQNTMR